MSSPEHPHPEGKVKMIVEFSRREEGSVLIFPDHFVQRAARDDMVFSQLFLQSGPFGFSLCWHKFSFLDSYKLDNSPSTKITGRIFK
jgi:hypothetical protein